MTVDNYNLIIVKVYGIYYYIYILERNNNLKREL